MCLDVTQHLLMCMVLGRFWLMSIFILIRIICHDLGFWSQGSKVQTLHLWIFFFSVTDYTTLLPMRYLEKGVQKVSTLLYLFSSKQLTSHFLIVATDAPLHVIITWKFSLQKTQHRSQIMACEMTNRVAERFVFNGGFTKNESHCKGSSLEVGLGVRPGKLSVANKTANRRKQHFWDFLSRNTKVDSLVLYVTRQPCSLC